jgi:SAM-dependent methyltransferase
MSIVCSSCGTSAEDAAQDCPSCGASLNIEDASAGTGDSAQAVSVVGRFRDSLKDNGIRRTLTLTANALLGNQVRPLFRRFARFADRRFDSRVNIGTSAKVHLEDLTIASENTDFYDELIYVPSPVLALRVLKSILPPDVGDYVFVDFGSGKGRVLFFASQFNFRKIVGIEFARELHEAAIENLRRGSHPKQVCFDVDSVLADAVDFQIPGDKCVFLLFNPFDEDVLSSVADNIRNSYLANPRAMFVIYFNPVFSSVFDALGMFELTKRLDSLRGVDYSYAVYRTREAAAARSDG